MDTLIKLITEKAGITEEQAKITVDTIKEYIQGKLPPMMKGMLDNFIKDDKKKGDDFI